MIALNRVDAKVNIAVRGLQARQSNLISVQIRDVGNRQPLGDAALAFPRRLMTVFGSVVHGKR
jgi:hypothetical protein